MILVTFGHEIYIMIFSVVISRICYTTLHMYTPVWGESSFHIMHMLRMKSSLKQVLFHSSTICRD